MSPHRVFVILYHNPQKLRKAHIFPTLCIFTATFQQVLPTFAALYPYAASNSHHMPIIPKNTRRFCRIFSSFFQFAQKFCLSFYLCPVSLLRKALHISPNPSHSFNRSLFIQKSRPAFRQDGFFYHSIVYSDSTN